MKTVAEMIAVMQAFENGAEIECRLVGKTIWNVISTPHWDWATTEYRVKVEALQVPWHMIRSCYEWAALDKSGGVYVYVTEPGMDTVNECWYPTGLNRRCACLTEVMSVATKGVNWQTSLTKRPPADTV